jgi:hypothetical protein
MVDHPAERRRYGRVRLEAPLAARFGDARVRVLELSVVGALIAHEGRLAVGEVRTLTIEWQGAKIELICRVARSALWRLAKSIGEKSVYHSGLSVAESVGDAYEHLRKLIAERIIRALEEQKSNARGIPPLNAYMYQPGKGDIFRRCELVDGTWRKTETIRPDQPHNGFTIAADVDPYQVDLLCRTWETTTTEGRRLTQLLAELSINKAEGVPTRRYVP